VRRLGRPRPRLTWLALPGSALAALAVGAGMLLALGANPVTGYRALLDGAFGDGYALSATAVKAVPLLLVGVGICIAFRANVFNIGGEGQIAMGALFATGAALALPGLPAGLMIPLTVLAGAVGGGLWGAIPGAFKGYFGVNEILSTIMLNLVAVQVMNYMLSGPLHDTTAESVGGLIPQTQLLPESSWLPILKDGTQLHLGVLVAVLSAFAVYVLLWRTSFGFRIRAVGLSRDAATYAGMRVARTTTLALTLSGALCGIAGSMLVFGSISHRMVTDGSLTGFTGSAGFNGIVVALFGGLNPLWTILSSFVFAGLLVGGDAMQVVTNVPSDLIVALNGLVVVFVVSVEFLRHRPRATGETTPGAPAEALAERVERVVSVEPTGAAEGAP
jgi:simple sugar transport system permease protein